MEHWNKAHDTKPPPMAADEFDDFIARKGTVH